MDYKMFSPDVVVRSEDGEVIETDDPDFLAWLDAGNSPFPPDPPVGDELENTVDLCMATIQQRKLKG